MSDRACRQCGALFTPTCGQNHFCASESCRRTRLRLAATKKNRKNGARSWSEYVAEIKLDSCRCAHCGTTFRPRDRSRVYCSRSCAVSAKRDRGEPRYTSVSKCSSCARFVRAPAKVCGECRPAAARAYMRQANMAKFVPRSRECKGCGVAFTPVYGHSLASYCSAACAKREVSHASRARRRGARVPGVVVGRIATFERADWRCHWCGISTPRELMGTYEANAPEMDHVVPLSRGGLHIPSNVVCSCRACNGEKSNRDPVSFGLEKQIDRVNRDLTVYQVILDRVQPDMADRASSTLWKI